MLTLLPQSSSMSVSLSGNEFPDIITKKSREKKNLSAVIVLSIGHARTKALLPLLEIYCM